MAYIYYRIYFDCNDSKEEGIVYQPDLSIPFTKWFGESLMVDEFKIEAYKPTGLKICGKCSGYDHQISAYDSDATILCEKCNPIPIAPTTCDGCKRHQPNQQGHMDVGGCMYDEEF